jgi:hypothetical protein
MHHRVEASDDDVTGTVSTNDPALAEPLGAAPIGEFLNRVGRQERLNGITRAALGADTNLLVELHDFAAGIDVRHRNLKVGQPGRVIRADGRRLGT